jgi:hypothetical protein
MQRACGRLLRALPLPRPLCGLSFWAATERLLLPPGALCVLLQALSLAPDAGGDPALLHDCLPAAPGAGQLSHGIAICPWWVGHACAPPCAWAWRVHASCLLGASVRPAARTNTQPNPTTLPPAIIWLATPRTAARASLCMRPPHLQPRAIMLGPWSPNCPSGHALWARGHPLVASSLALRLPFNNPANSPPLPLLWQGPSRLPARVWSLLLLGCAQHTAAAAPIAVLRSLLRSRQARCSED